MDVDVSCIDCNDDLEVIEEWTDWHGNHLKVKPCDHVTAELAECQQQRDALAEVVKDASKRQRKCLEIMRDNNLVLDNLDDPMQKLAFTFYNDLVAIAMQADNALAMLDE